MTTKIDAARALVAAREARLSVAEQEHEAEKIAAEALGHVRAQRARDYITGHDDASAAAAARIKELEAERDALLMKLQSANATVQAMSMVPPAAEPVRVVGDDARYAFLFSDKHLSYHSYESREACAHAFRNHEGNVVAILDPSQIVCVRSVGVIEDYCVRFEANAFNHPGKLYAAAPDAQGEDT